MPDILADAKAWIAANDGDTSEDHGEIEAMLRGLVKEVEALRAGTIPADWLAMHAADKRMNDNLRGEVRQLRVRWDNAIEYARSLPSDKPIAGWTVLDALVALETPDA